MFAQSKLGPPSRSASGASGGRSAHCWFPRRERALATGIFNAGTNVGAIVTPMVVPFVTVRFGWEWAFIGTGVAGLGWLVVWWLWYHQPEAHPKVTAAEVAYVRSDPPE